MKVLILCLLTACAVVRAVPAQGVKGWRGITPLHSERRDVERLLGRPESSNKYVSSYELGDVAVSVTYSDGPPCGTTAVDEWKVPPDTVVSINVTPKHELRLADVGVNGPGYRESADPLSKGVFYYTNEEEGVRYTVRKTEEAPQGLVTAVTYIPAARDHDLHCSGATSGASDDRASYPPLDKFGNVPTDNERARLDNLAVELLQQVDLKAAIIFYAASCDSAETEYARNRADKARRYMISKRGVHPERVSVINGGNRGEFMMELYLIPARAPSPSPASASRPCQR